METDCNLKKINLLFFKFSLLSSHFLAETVTQVYELIILLEENKMLLVLL